MIIISTTIFSLFNIFWEFSLSSLTFQTSKKSIFKLKYEMLKIFKEPQINYKVHGAILFCWLNKLQNVYEKKEKVNNKVASTSLSTLL
jgi:hypothetical protein